MKLLRGFLRLFFEKIVFLAFERRLFGKDGEMAEVWAG